MSKQEKNIIAYVMNLPPSVLASVKAYQKITGIKYKVMLIREESVEIPVSLTGYDILVSCDFSKPSSIASALLP